MTRVPLTVAFLSGAAIIFIGLRYLFIPRSAVPSFGLPPPALGDATTHWLRLKGIRDVVSGLVVFATMYYGTPRLVGIIMLVEALTPLGDMSTILYGNGSTGTALGVHGITAVVMIMAGLSLLRT